MNYDKNSFLSGIAVGRQMKGWGAPLESGDPPAGFVFQPTEADYANPLEVYVSVRPSGGATTKNTVQITSGQSKTITINTNECNIVARFYLSKTCFAVGGYFQPLVSGTSISYEYGLSENSIYFPKPGVYVRNNVPFAMSADSATIEYAYEGMNLNFSITSSERTVTDTSQAVNVGSLFKTGSHYSYSGMETMYFKTMIIIPPYYYRET